MFGDTEAWYFLGYGNISCIEDGSFAGLVKDDAGAFDKQLPTLAIDPYNVGSIYQILLRFGGPIVCRVKILDHESIRSTLIKIMWKYDAIDIMQKFALEEVERFLEEEDDHVAGAYLSAIKEAREMVEVGETDIKEYEKVAIQVDKLKEEVSVNHSLWSGIYAAQHAIGREPGYMTGQTVYHLCQAYAHRETNSYEDERIVHGSRYVELTNKLEKVLMDGASSSILS